MSVRGLAGAAEVYNSVPGRAEKPGKVRKVKYVAFFKNLYAEKANLGFQELYSDEQLKSLCSEINSGKGDITVFEVKNKLNLKLTVAFEKA